MGIVLVVEKLLVLAVAAVRHRGITYTATLRANDDTKK